MPPPVPPSSQPPPTPTSRFLLPRRPDRTATATPTRPRSHAAPTSSATRSSSQPQRRASRFVPSWTQSQTTPARQADAIDEGSSSPPAPTPIPPTWRVHEQPLLGQHPLIQPTQPPVRATQETPSASRVLWQPRWQSARRQQAREDIEEAEDGDLNKGARDIDYALTHTAICDTIEEGESEEGQNDHGDEEEQPQDLLSVARPYKRRRLFVSPGKVASSPPPFDRGDETTATTERYRRIVDDIDDGGEDDYYENDRNQKPEYDEIGDILEDDGLLASWGKPGANAHDDAYDSEEEDFMLFDASPRRHKTEDGQRRQPTLQRARLFLAARQQHGSVPDEGDEFHDYDDDAEDDHRGHAGVDLQQKQHYQNPPPDFFSPQKRHKKRQRLPQQKNGAAAGTGAGQFVAGGLAAELRDWLVQIKVQTRSVGSHGQTRYVVDEARASSGMCLVLGHRQPAEADPQPPSTTRLLLAGSRPLVPSGGDGSTAVMLTNGHVVVLAPPVWDVVLGGQTWTVASDWAVEG